MQFGLDYVIGPPIADLKAHNVTFVCRYLSSVNALTKVKLLTPQEADTLLKADIAIVSNYEWYAERVLEGYQSGQQDAQIAASQHHACGGPPDSPIYFSVDMDLQGPEVVNYFNGVHSVLPLSRIGAYGSYRVIKFLLDNHLITWAWQTYAWSGGQWDSRRHIEQYENGMTIGGASVDYNHALTTDFGQWRTITMIDLSNPDVAAHFEASGNGWKCKANGKIIHGAILTHYMTCGYKPLCGLSVAGLPESNEVPIENIGASAGYPFKKFAGHGFVVQFFERQAWIYDPQHLVDNPTGSGSVYPLHLYDLGPGTDPRVFDLKKQEATLSAQVADLQKQIAAAPGNIALQQELDAANAKLAQIKALVG